MCSTLAQIVDAAAAEIKHLKQCDDEQDHEQHHRECRGIPRVEELKSLAKNVEVEHTGGIGRTALGHHVHRVEDLRRPNDGGHEHKEHGWAQERQCNGEELPQSVCPA